MKILPIIIMVLLLAGCDMQKDKFAYLEGTEATDISDAPALGTPDTADKILTVNVGNAAGSRLSTLTFGNAPWLASGGTAVNSALLGGNASSYFEVAQTVASQAEMEAGTETDIRSMSPLRVKQAVDSLSTDDQTIDVFTLSGTTLQLSLEGDGEATKEVDLSSLQDGTGDPTTLSLGTVTETTVGITSDGDADDVVLPAADTDGAGVMTTSQVDALVEIAARTAPGEDGEHGLSHNSNDTAPTPVSGYDSMLTTYNDRPYHYSDSAGGFLATTEIPVSTSSTGRALTQEEYEGGCTVVTAASDYTFGTLTTGDSGCIVAGEGDEIEIGVTPPAGMRFVHRGTAKTTATQLTSAGELGDRMNFMVVNSTDIFVELIGTWAE